MPKKTPALPVFRAAVIPENGEIVGGALHGWHYGFLRLELRGGVPSILVRATPPNWPFPTEPIRLGNNDFERLRSPGMTAYQWDSQTLIKLQQERQACAST